MDIIDTKTDSNGETNLMRYVRDKDNDSIREYIDKEKISATQLKNVINMKDSRYRTALMYAVMSERYDFVEDLITLTSGTIDLNAQDIDNKTALMYAVQFYNPRIVEILVKAGANLDIETNSGKKAIDFARNSLAFLTEGTEEGIKERLKYDGRDRELDLTRIENYKIIIDYIDRIKTYNNSEKSGGKKRKTKKGKRVNKSKESRKGKKSRKERKSRKGKKI
jgi:hypothetical protein